MRSSGGPCSSAPAPTCRSASSWRWWARRSASELDVEEDPARVRPPNSEVERLISSPGARARSSRAGPRRVAARGALAHDRVDRAQRRQLPRRRLRGVSATAVRATALVVIGRDAEIRQRAAAFADSLRRSGLEVEVRRHSLLSRTGCRAAGGTPALSASLRPRCRRRASPGRHPWIAVHGTPWPADAGWRQQIESRLLRMADVAASPSPEGIADLHRRASANAVEIDPAGRDLARLVALARAWREPSSGLRVLVLGPTNSPHVEDFAIALRERGAEVFVAGLPWGGGLGPSVLPAAGIPVLSATWPATLWIRRLMRELRPAVVHAHWLPNAVSARLGGARPLVATAGARTSPRLRPADRQLPMAGPAGGDGAGRLQRAPVRAGRRPGGPWLRPGRSAWASTPRVLAGGEAEGGAPPVASASRRADGPERPRLEPDLQPRGRRPAFDRLAERRPDVQLVLKHNSSEPRRAARAAVPRAGPRCGPAASRGPCRLVPRRERLRLAREHRLIAALSVGGDGLRLPVRRLRPSVGTPGARPGRHALLAPIEPEAARAGDRAGARRR